MTVAFQILGNNRMKHNINGPTKSPCMSIQDTSEFRLAVVTIIVQTNLGHKLFRTPISLKHLIVRGDI